MTNNKITKLLQLLNDNKLEELRTELTAELMQSTDKKKANIFNEIKKYLNKGDDFRPVLKTIQNNNGKQFICNGFTAYRFDTHRPELEVLQNTSELESININAVIDDKAQYTAMNKNDLLLLTNIKKYISLYKTQDFYMKKQNIPIFFANKIFNSEFILECANIFGGDYENLSIYSNMEKECDRVQLKSKDITAVILPLRINSEEEKNKTIEFTNKFIKNIMNI